MAGPLGCRLFSCKMECYAIFSYAHKIHSRKLFRHIDFCLSKFLTFSSKKHDPLTKPAFFQARTTMVDKMEANKASTSSDGSALEAMNSDGKEDIVVAAAKKQETFSPQVLKAVEEIFESRSVKEVREIEVRTRKEAEDKQEELRQIIGSSYKDAIANADDLVRMSEETKNLSECIEEIKDLVKIFGTLDVSEEAEEASRKNKSGDSADGTTGKHENDEIDQELRDVLYAAGSRVKYLVDSPEQIWGYLEAGSCYEAAKRFGASKVILACLQEKMKAEERIFKTFPLITAQANALHSFAGQISKRSRLALQRVTDTPEQVASALCAVCVVEDIKEPRVLLQVLLQSRRAWVRANLRKLNSETDALRLGKALGLICAEIRKTTRLARKLFVENEDSEEGKPLFFQTLNRRPMEGNSQFSGVSEATREDELWHESISARERSTVPQSKESVSSAIQSWLADVAVDAKTRGKNVFEGLDKCARLAEAERNANEMCEKIERAHLRKLSAGKSNNSTIMTTSWSEFSLAFLDKDIDILTTLFEEPMLERGKTLLANSLAHVSARKLLNDALTEESILENIKAGENTDFWLNEDSSNSNTPGSPPGLSLARSLASKIDQSLKSARDDALLLARHGGKSSSSYSSLYDEKRIQFLEPFVKEEAARGIVGFSSFLNEKVEEIKRDSVKRTRSKDIVVEKALLCGRLAHAIATHSSELSLILGPASEWYNVKTSTGSVRKASSKTCQNGSNRILTETNEALISSSDEAFSIWVEYASSLCIKDLEENLLNDDQLELAHAPHDWETIALGTSDDVTIELPVLPSSYVMEMLHRASRLVSKAGGHVLSKRALKHFADALGCGAMSVYANFLGLSDSSVSKKVQLLNNTELSEKGALQMLFDQRLVHDFLAGGVKPSPVAPKLANEKAQVITQSLVKGIDPIDWATYEPHLWENEAKCYVRCSVLLGSFVQLYKLHKDVSTAASKKRTPASSTTSTASETLRFSYLPVSLPALRGGSGRDAEKGEVDWGLIQNLKDESNEQSNVFSKIASFF